MMLTKQLITAMWENHKHEVVFPQLHFKVVQSLNVCWTAGDAEQSGSAGGFREMMLSKMTHLFVSILDLSLTLKIASL